jgi:hypothetical protein
MTEHFWCMIQGCNRSESYSGQKQPFSRRDKRNEHVRRVHKAAKRNYKAGEGDLPYITGKDATFTPQTIGDTSMGPFTDSAGHSRAARLTELAPFHDATRLVGVTDLTGLGGFGGFTGVDISTRPLGPISLYSPPTFSGAAGIADDTDTTVFAGLAGYANDSSSMAVTGFPSVDGSGWLTAGSDFTRLTDIDGSIAYEGVTDVGSSTAGGTFTTDDEFGWFPNFSMSNEFSGIDTSTDLNQETSAPHVNNALESINSAM